MIILQFQLKWQFKQIGKLRVMALTHEQNSVKKNGVSYIEKLRLLYLLAL